MFGLASDPADAPKRAPADAVTAAEVHTMLARLSTTPGPAVDADRIDVLRALEELKCAAEGVQVQVTADLAESRRLRDEATGVPKERQGRGLGHLVGLARRESPWRGQRHVQLATVLTRELPHTYAALRAGKTTEDHATVLARETSCLTRDHRVRVDHTIAHDTATLERHTPKTLAAAAGTLAAHLDPAAVVAKRRIAETARHTSLRPAPDTMTWFSAALPVRDGIAVHIALEQAALHAQATGDPRTRGQLMADTLVARVTGRGPDTTYVRHDEATNDMGGSSTSGVVVNLVMTDTQLFDTSTASEGTAHLDRYGPIDADLARELITTEPDRVWLRRLYTDPHTRQLTAMDSRQRCFPDGLKTLIRLRDQTCRTPWCDAPIRHTDHITDYANTGATTYLNGQGLCQACNHAKQDNWWATPSPHGTIKITTTTGHTYQSHPPQPPDPIIDDDPDTTYNARSTGRPGSPNEEPAWLAPSWIAHDPEQLIAHGWTQTPIDPPIDCPCGR